MTSRALSTDEVASLCGVHPRSVLRWAKKGVLPAFQTGGGWWRVRPERLLRFMRERGMEVPPQLLGERRSAVLVDDDAGFLASLRASLTALRSDVELHSADNGFEGGVLVGLHRPDLVVLDLVMPVIDGAQVCRMIRAQPELDATAVVFLSGALTPKIERELLASGADRCLSKPVDELALEGLLARYLPRGEAAAAGGTG